MLVAQNSLGPVCPVPLTVRGTSRRCRRRRPRSRRRNSPRPRRRRCGLPRRGSRPRPAAATLSAPITLAPRSARPPSTRASARRAGPANAGVTGRIRVAARISSTVIPRRAIARPRRTNVSVPRSRANAARRPGPASARARGVSRRTAALRGSIRVPARSSKATTAPTPTARRRTRTTASASRATRTYAASTDHAVDGVSTFVPWPIDIQELLKTQTRDATRADPAPHRRRRTRRAGTRA